MRNIHTTGGQQKGTWHFLKTRAHKELYTLHTMRQCTPGHDPQHDAACAALYRQPALREACKHATALAAQPAIGCSTGRCSGLAR